MREDRRRLVYEVARRAKRGDSRRSIARALGISRKTVARMLTELADRRAAGDDVLARELPPGRAPRPSKLDPWLDRIADLVAEYPDIRATRVLEELQAMGFDGSYTIVREHLKQIRPKPKRRAAQLVETAPGQQAQVDWSPYELADGTAVYAFSVVMSYSRCQYLHFCRDMRQPTVFRQLRRAFEYLGGVADEYVFDTMPGVVDRWELDVPVLNLRAIDFATYYDFEIHVAPRNDGAYKGKVERRFRHANESLFNGRTFHTIEALNTTTAWWLRERRNNRKHSRNGRIPFEALREEPLNPIPPRPYDDRELAHRIVDSYGYVAFDGNWYRVEGHVGEWVYVRASESEVAVIAGPATVVVRRRRAPRNAGAYVPPPPNRTEKKPRRRPVSELLPCFEAWGDVAVAYAGRLLEPKRGAAARLGHLLHLRESWAFDDILAAIEHAARYGAWDPRKVERILEANATPRSRGDLIADRARSRIREVMASEPVRQRPLGDYARLLGGSDTNEGARSERADDGRDPT